MALPDSAARTSQSTAMLWKHLQGMKTALSNADLAKITAHTDGYSGSDMEHLVKEALQVMTVSKLHRSDASLSLDVIS